ncbi:MAG: hypothetical protein OXF98_13455 [Rhodospirillaceae bacterium]|nr:hypothetical protein [Rhodospirillaceae bacterium]
MAHVRRVARQRHLIRALAGSTILFLLGSPAVLQARTDWVTVGSANFQVISDGGERLGVQTASDLERVRWIFFQGPGLGGVSAVRPITVFALQDGGSIRDLITEPHGSRDIVSYSRSTAERNFIVVDNRRRQSSTADALYSSYFNVFTRAAVRPASRRPWRRVSTPSATR